MTIYLNDFTALRIREEIRIWILEFLFLTRGVNNLTGRKVAAALPAAERSFNPVPGSQFSKNRHSGETCPRCP